MEEARSDPKFEWSVESVLHVITSTAGQVRWSERLRAFQELRWDCGACVATCTMRHLHAALATVIAVYTAATPDNVHSTSPSPCH